MSVEHVKSATVTNLDASPVVANTRGEGAAGFLKEISGYATVLASSSQDSTYQLVRVPSTAKIKGIWLESEAQAAGTLDLGVYYATDGGGGKPTALLAANAISQAFFASAYAVTSLSQPTQVVNESGTYTIGLRNMPLWQALSIAADPGGFFDIVATVTATAITTGTGKLGISVQYVD